MVATIGITACGHAILLSPETHRINDPRLGRVLQINCLARGAERKVHVRLGEINKAARLNECVGWKDKLVCQRIVGEHAAGEVKGLVVVIVEFDVIDLTVVGVGEEFVDDDIAQGIGVGRFQRAR